MSATSEGRHDNGAGAGPHPSAADLVNLAREELGRKKTQRILEHCKRCPACAELLLDAVNNQPFEGERLRLSKWNWISIGVLLAAVIGVFALLLWLLAGAGRSPRQFENVEPAAETLYSEQPESWFEALFTRVVVAPGGDTMLRFGERGVSLLDLAGRADLHERLLLDFGSVMTATYDGNGALARYANKRHDLGWFIVEGGELRSTPLPPDSAPVWSAGNADVAWVRPPATRIHLGYPPQQRTYEAGGRVLGMAWAPSGEQLYALVMDDAGDASLVRARRAVTQLEVVRADLDASPLPNGIAMSPDGRSVFVALASDGAPDAAARHEPAGDRDLDIYAIDLRDGRLRRVIGSTGDDFWPGVQDDALYWTHNRQEASVVLIPRAEEGLATVPMRTVAGHDLDGVDAQLPQWDPRGGRLVYTRGPWRLADWGLPFDVMRLDVAADGRPIGQPEPLITGYHQDLTPSISSDGRWLAWHSRRSATPVPYYAGPGVADDVFIRAADDAGAPERRVSESGWEVGNPSWGPDGRLIFDTWDRGGVPSVSRPWIATIDSDSGEPLARERLRLPDEVGGSVSAVWSPIADELLIIERRDPGSQTLWLMSLSAGSVERLVDFASRTLGGASFTPDGSAVVYAASVDGRMQLYEISRAGGVPRRLTDDAAGLMHPSVSPDGRWIAATKLVQRKELRRAPLATLR
ncbi:MAG: hypothetical protein PVJ51_01240 [Acidobacteriota bacterium]|jgi:Tol biopolymer transport system component